VVAVLLRVLPHLVELVELAVAVMELQAHLVAPGEQRILVVVAVVDMPHLPVFKHLSAVQVLLF
jgi:hypothetical protein